MRRDGVPGLSRDRRSWRTSRFSRAMKRRGAPACLRERVRHLGPALGDARRAAHRSSSCGALRLLYFFGVTTRARLRATIRALIQRCIVFARAPGARRGEDAPRAAPGRVARGAAACAAHAACDAHRARRRRAARSSCTYSTPFLFQKLARAVRLQRGSDLHRAHVRTRCAATAARSSSAPIARRCGRADLRRARALAAGRLRRGARARGGRRLCADRRAARLRRIFRRHRVGQRPTVYANTVRNLLSLDTAGARCAPSGTSTGPQDLERLRCAPLCFSRVGEAFGDDAVAARVRMDRVGLQARVPQHLGR